MSTTRTTGTQLDGDNNGNGTSEDALRSPSQSTTPRHPYDAPLTPEERAAIDKIRDTPEGRQHAGFWRRLND